MIRFKIFLALVGKMLFGDYQLNRIYKLSTNSHTPALKSNWKLIEIGHKEIIELRKHDNQKVRKSAGYAIPQMRGFGIRVNGKLACVAFFADRSIYTNDSTWPLERGEMALVELVTDPEFRGEGLAPAIIAHSSKILIAAGVKGVYSWHWWTNTSSRRAFEKINWTYIAFTIELYPLKRLQPMIFRSMIKAKH